MITRGLKREDSAKWVWLDDYVIKQEEVAVAVESVTQQVTTMDSSADQPVTSKGIEQDPVVPSPPSQNGPGLRTNTQVSPRSTPVPTSIVGQPTEGVISTARCTPAVEIFDQTPYKVCFDIRVRRFFLTLPCSRNRQTILRGNVRWSKMWCAIFHEAKNQLLRFF